MIAGENRTKEPQLFSIGYGSNRREQLIESWLSKDPGLALILAAIHFEWTIKRTILALGSTPTPALRKQLSDAFKLGSADNSEKTLAGLWQGEVAKGRKRASLGLVVTQLPYVQSKALKARGKIVHGNGVLPVAEARESTEIFLKASKQMRKFAFRQGADIDKRIRARRARIPNSGIGQ